MNLSLDGYALHIDAGHLPNHTFLLGNRGGFTLYLPATCNERLELRQPIKWFGASGFGRSFYEGTPIWAGSSDPILLSHANQVEFIMDLDHCERVYRVGEHEVREHYFVPDKLQAFVLTVSSDLALSLRPEFDMRFYQSFNSDFSHYGASVDEGLLRVSNCVDDIGPLHQTMRFYSVVGADGGTPQITLAPEAARLVKKTYLKDEMRDKLIQTAYRETQAQAPDEAPIWDQYSTQVYSPATISTSAGTTLIFAFGDTEDEARATWQQVRDRLPALRDQKRRDMIDVLHNAGFETGNADVDLAYAHVLARFNDALVARDATLHVEPVHRQHYYAIYAGDKYFMDAWKRDENISLGALLVTSDYLTARAILDNTWQFQDERTGRLPHIIRAGEPLVYYSSDGTLWALRRLFEYTVRSGDRSLLDAKMSMVRHFFAASMTFVKRGLLPSGGIIDPSYRWETWEDTPYTPRDGYPVEIELLWLNALDCYLPWIRSVDAGLADAMERTRTEGRETFGEFRCDGYLVDSLSYTWEQRRILTPNGYVAFALGYDLPDDLARSMVEQARDQLAGRVGVRSLAPRDWPTVLPSAFLHDPADVQGKNMRSVGIFNYHRGIEWLWLNPFFVAGELQCGDAQHALENYVRGQVESAIHTMGVGGLSELFDMRGQVGADFQAWSMAGFIGSLHEFAGVSVDALRRHVGIEPWLPASWPYVRVRAQIGACPFRVQYERGEGATHRLSVSVDGDVPADHTLQVSLPVGQAGVSIEAQVNGAAISHEQWSVTCVCGTSGPWRARLDLPFGPVELTAREVGAGPASR